MKFHPMLLVGAGALLLIGSHADRARAQEWGPEMQRLHALCDQGDRHACIRFGMLLGEHHERWGEWRHSHPEWWGWER
jgi:hypothetical protein